MFELHCDAMMIVAQARVQRIDLAAVPEVVERRAPLEAVRQAQRARRDAGLEAAVADLTGVDDRWRKTGRRRRRQRDDLVAGLLDVVRPVERHAIIEN